MRCQRWNLMGRAFFICFCLEAVRPPRIDLNVASRSRRVKLFVRLSQCESSMSVPSLSKLRSLSSDSFSSSSHYCATFYTSWTWSWSLRFNIFFWLGVSRQPISAFSFLIFVSSFSSTLLLRSEASSLLLLLLLEKTFSELWILLEKDLLGTIIDVSSSPCLRRESRRWLGASLGILFLKFLSPSS